MFCHVFLINIKILLPKALDKIFVEVFKIIKLRFIVLAINNLMQTKVILLLFE